MILSKETMDILRGLDEEVANRVIAECEDSAPQCYFCGHWDIERVENSREVCRKCGAEARYGFSLGRWESREEERLSEIEELAFGLRDSADNIFVKFGESIWESVESFLKEHPLPCPECKKTAHLKKENGRWVCEKCGVKAPTKNDDNPNIMWNVRLGRRDYGDGSTW